MKKYNYTFWSAVILKDINWGWDHRLNGVECAPQFLIRERKILIMIMQKADWKKNLLMNLLMNIH